MYWSVLLSIVDRVLTLRILAAGPAILLLIALRTGGPMGSPMEGLSMEMMWLIVLVTFIICQIGVNRLESTKDHGWARQQALRRAQPLQASNDAEFWSKATAPSLNGPGSTGSVPVPPVSSKTTTRSARIEGGGASSPFGHGPISWGCHCPIPPSEPVPWIVPRCHHPRFGQGTPWRPVLWLEHRKTPSPASRPSCGRLDDDTHGAS